MSDNLQDRVQHAIDELVASGAEIGLQVAVYHHGELVVDAVAGAADRDTGRPVTSDTLFYAASTGKAATATVASWSTTRPSRTSGRSSRRTARTRPPCGTC